MASGTEAVTVEQVARALGVPAPAPPLPSEYTRLEYIEGTGAQYIDTGFKADYNTRFTADFMLNSTSTAYIFASRGARSESYKNAVGILWNGTNFRSDYGSISGAKITGPTTGVRYDVDKNKATCRIGTETVTNSSSSFSSMFNVYLFGCNEGGSLSYPASMRLWSFAIYDNSELVRDFVPAKRSSDGAVGLYDTVTGAFFGNSGTGAFVAGPEVATSHVDGAEVAAVTLKQFKVAAAKNGHR